MAIRPLSDSKLEAIRQNIFPSAHAAIADWYVRAICEGEKE